MWYKRFLLLTIASVQLMPAHCWGTGNLTHNGDICPPVSAHLVPADGHPFQLVRNMPATLIALAEAFPFEAKLLLTLPLNVIAAGTRIARIKSVSHRPGSIAGSRGAWKSAGRLSTQHPKFPDIVLATPLAPRERPSERPLAIDEPGLHLGLGICTAEAGPLPVLPYSWCCPPLSNLTLLSHWSVFSCFFSIVGLVAANKSYRPKHRRDASHEEPSGPNFARPSDPLDSKINKQDGVLAIRATSHVNGSAITSTWRSAAPTLYPNDLAFDGHHCDDYTKKGCRCGYNCPYGTGCW